MILLFNNCFSFGRKIESNLVKHPHMKFSELGYIFKLMVSTCGYLFMSVNYDDDDAKIVVVEIDAGPFTSQMIYH